MTIASLARSGSGFGIGSFSYKLTNAVII
jgi:hypothetical protein